MGAGPFRQHRNQCNDKPGEDRGGKITADCKAAVGEGLGEQIAERRSERPRENEGSPEQVTRDVCVEA